MCVRIVRIVIPFLVLSLMSPVRAQDPPPAATPQGPTSGETTENSSNENDGQAHGATAAEIAAWVAGLDSDIYSARRRATEELILVGQPAIQPLVNAVQQGSLETISRGVFVLRQLALTSEDGPTSIEAYRALKSLQDQRFTTAARHALSALQAVHENRHAQAHRQLTDLGAVIGLTPVTSGLGIQQAFPSVTIGDNWRGTLEDLRRLNWITQYRPNDGAPPWMIVLEGSKITDAFLDYIQPLENVAVVKIRSAPVTNEGVAKLVGLRDLQILELLYTPLSDPIIDHLQAMPKLERIRLFGSQLSAEGWQRMEQLKVRYDIELKKGGFLGIGCANNPCRVMQVRPESVAAAAGIQVGDIVVSYNQQPVQTMTELADLIAQNAPGEKVLVELLRNETEKLTKEVELGKWD